MRFKRILLLLAAFHIAFALKAIDEIKNARIEGNAVSVGHLLSIKDDKFPNTFISGWDNGFAFMKDKGTVEFGIDEDKHAFYASDFSVEITFDVTATDKYNNQQVFTNKKLTVFYKRSGVYTDKAQLVFDGFVKLDVTITNLNSKALPSGLSIATPKELYLEAEIATTRNYLFYSHNAPASGPTNLNYNILGACQSSPSQMEIYWDYVPGAEEYELEWTWVNDYTGSIPEYDFRYDATRIITKNTYYRIPLLYESGFIVYRLRHIGRAGNGFSQRVEGPWTSYPEKDLVSNYPAHLKYHVNPYSGDNINWSSTFTFDENGKKGSGISFMDGMLMGRQSLAKLNTENKVIAQSVVYDYQGRPAISVLPVPVNTECLIYQNGLNNNLSGTAYGQANFDDDGLTSCISVTDPMNVTAGASNYYSASNSNKEGAQGYVPIADGLPFVQVEYTNDMTGRIKSQSMPGAAHKLGTGKETKFYYSNPGDGELYQLFGSEVGNVRHYDKNIVRDANGQLSASYLDMEGRVIATSLLGPKPASLDGIEDYNASATLKDDMVKYNVENRNDYSLTATKNIFIEQAGATQSFIYEFTPEDFSDACAPSLCFDCLYEVTFKITDDCNLDITTPVTTIVGNVSLTSTVLNNCDLPSVKYELSPGVPLTVTFPKTGNYIVTKTLKVSDMNLDVYAQNYIANNTCFDSYNDILQDQIAAIDFSSCNTDCQSCLTSVSSYTLNYPTTHPSSPPLTQAQIDKLVEECETLCLDQMDPCFMAKQQMLEDFHPGGQYAGYNTTNFTSTDNTSILSASNKFGISYTNSGLNYVDANGNGNVYVNVYRAGILYHLPVHSLTIEEFVNNFQPSWADAFLNYHPEKCYLDFCELNKSSDLYDYEMLQVNTYDEAFAKGFLKPINGISLPSLCPSTAFTPNTDPFFTTGSGGTTTINNVLIANGFSTYKDVMLSYFTSYPETAYGGQSLFNVAKSIGSGSAAAHNFGCDACTKDQEWMAFRALYLNQKIRLLSQAKTDYVINHGCFNGCMQGSGLQPFKPTTGNTSVTPAYTSLNFMKGNFTFTYGAPSAFYQFFSLAAYPVTKSPLVSGSTNVHDGFFYAPQNTTEAHPCASEQSGAFDTKVAHFQQLPFDVDGLVTYYQNLLSTNPDSGPSVIPSNPTASTSSSNLYCQNTCASYADEWINKLKACNPVFDIDNTTSYNATFVNLVKAGLVEVCVKGCDFQNPFGSSTVNPSLVNTAPNNFDSFEEVIAYYAASYPSYIPNPTSDACSYLNLDFPEPYGHDYSTSGSGAQNKLDTCGCNKVLSTNLKFNQLLTAGSLPSGVTTVEQYFTYLYNTPIYNFNELSCKCSSAASGAWNMSYQWSSAQSTTLLSYAIPVSEVLSCTKCLPCSTIVNAVNQFNSAHSKWLGTPSYKDLLENSLNASLNMNLIADDYLDFYNNCMGVLNSSGNTTGHDLMTFLNEYVYANFTVLPAYTPQVYTFNNITYNVVSSGYSPAYPIVGVSYCSPLSSSVHVGDLVNTRVGGGGYALVSVTGFFTDSYTDLVRIPKMQFPSAFAYFNPLLASATAVILPPTPFNGSFVFSTNPYPGSPCNTSLVNTECQLIMKDLSSMVNLPDFTITNVVVNIPTGHPITGVSGTGQTANFAYDYSYTQAGKTVYVANNFGYYGCIYQAAYPATSLCNQPYTPSLPIYEDCLSSMMNQAETNAKLLYQSYVDKYTAEFKKKYKDKCLTAQETYERTYNLNEYHYTLYYYDQAGNLTRTVAPKGVRKLSSAQVTQLQSAAPPVIYPTHTYVTNYTYQSYGAPTNSKTPDETITNYYFYDPIGRIQLSLNGKQKTEGKYSYTLYDELGRIKEVGVIGNLPGTVDVDYLKNTIATNGFEAFINALPSPSIKSEVIKTYYDAPLNTTIAAEFGANGQTNLRNRVATVTYENEDDANDHTFTYATHYTYDEHGNVGRVIQDMPALAPVGKQFYKMDYDYDLISGNVNQVTFQKDQPDQFMHRYEYDADNRLHLVYTSKDNINWDKDAKYFYYEHGPLARTELGDQKVQGTDFAYTIHGWIKAVNSNILSENTDMGKDGAHGNAYNSAQNNLHRFVGQDAAGYSLNYYQQNGLSDYQAIKAFSGSANQNLIASTANILTAGSFNLQTDAPDLFNGNISSMVTSIYDIDPNVNNTHTQNTSFPQITAYKYDQLHRIKQMKAFRDVSLANNEWASSSAGSDDGSYLSQFTYDKNGNILTLQRNGAAFMTGLGLPMDKLTYIIQDASANPTNKLIGVKDAATGAYVTDIKGTSSAVDGTPASYDYDYDAIGSLIQDKKEFIQSIEWTVDRKVKKVIRDGAAMAAAGKNRPDLEFEYDANRQRVVKIVKPHTAGGSLMDQSNWVYTYYVRDASGNISATYSRKFVPVVGSPNTYTEFFTLQEHDLYGSSRLGTLPEDFDLGQIDFTADVIGGVFDAVSYMDPTPVTTPLCTLLIATPAGGNDVVSCPMDYERALGHKRFELTNHLGNVLSVISDRKLQVDNPVGSVVLEEHFNTSSSVQNWVTLGNYPASVDIVWQAGSKLRLKATVQNANAAVIAPVVEGVNYTLQFNANFTTTDGKLIIFAENNGVFTTIGTQNLVSGANTFNFTALAGTVYIEVYEFGIPSSGAYIEIDDVLLTASSGQLVDKYQAEILETHDYYAFGYEMPGRSTGQEYKFGFNGKLDDKSDGWQIQDYGFRAYDYRLGRFLSTDPLTASFAYLTPYQFASNRPIDGVDLDGKEWRVSAKMVLGKNNKPKLVITLHVKAGFTGTEGLPKRFLKMAELYVENMYKAQYVTSTDMEVEIETAADFYQINNSSNIPVSFGYAEIHPNNPSITGETMDNNGGHTPNSQDAYITLFRKHRNKKTGLIIATSIYDLLETIAHELGHTVGLEHDGEGNLYDADAIKTDEHNLMYWLGADDTKAHLELFQILRVLIRIQIDLKNIPSGSKSNETKPDILGSPKTNGNGGEGDNRTS